MYSILTLPMKVFKVGSSHGEDEGAYTNLGVEIILLHQKGFGCKKIFKNVHSKRHHLVRSGEGAEYFCF